jgi:hypothetical protein
MPGLRRQVVNGKREKYTEYVGRPAVATVAEGADKPATGAELASVTLDIVKAAGVVMLTEELIEDAGGQLLARIDADIRTAFADWVDSNALGRTSGGTIVGSFNSELSETTSTVELGTTGDAFAIAVSSAMATIEANGYQPTGIIAANDVGQHLRNARTALDTHDQPLYYDGFQANPGVPTMYGLPIRGRRTSRRSVAPRRRPCRGGRRRLHAGAVRGPQRGPPQGLDGRDGQRVRHGSPAVAAEQGRRPVGDARRLRRSRSSTGRVRRHH